MKAILIALIMPLSMIASAQKVMLDSYFNNEHKKDATGQMRSWHYKWEETAMSGFSILGQQFLRNGADTATLYDAPTAANLKGAAIYIIVDADNAKENPSPNLISSADMDAIEQ